jgi:hypothetical protein
MSRSLTRIQALKLGIVVVVAVVLGIWGLFQVGERQRLWGDTIEVRAGFTEAHGISKGAPVRVRGINAGQVVQVELPSPDDPDGKVFLRLQIDKRFQPLLLADAKAIVQSEGVLGGRVLNIDPGRDKAHPLSEGGEIAGVEAGDLSDLARQSGELLNEVRKSNGTIGKLVRDDGAYREVVELAKETRYMVAQGKETFRKGEDAIKRAEETLKKGEEALAAVQQGTEALKKMPFVRNYVVDTQGLLFRPDQQRQRRVFAESDLFVPGEAVLTETGRERLVRLYDWLAESRVSGSDVVVVGYSNPSSEVMSHSVATVLTQKQAEAVTTFLCDHVKAHRISWWSSRKVTPLGCGLALPPIPEKDPLPPSRIEVQLFLPR